LFLQVVAISKRPMRNNIIVQYVGFEAKMLVREYAFTVREGGSGESREYTLTITQEAFGSHRARYQDGPDICSLRLHRELATNENHPLHTHFCVTDNELTEYYDAHRQKTLRRYQIHCKD
jgi:hypothetical protein